jgi:hypothetical protein
MSGRSGEDAVDAAPGAEESAAGLEESKSQILDTAVAAVRFPNARAVEEA